MKDYEIGIVDLVDVLRKHRRPIAAVTAVCALAAAVFIFSRPRIWEIDAIFYPARINGPNEKGEMTSLMIHPFPTLVRQLETREFAPYIAKKSGLALERIPWVTVSLIPGTNQVRLSLLDNDIESSEIALSALLQILEIDQNAMLDAKIKAAGPDLIDLDKKAADLDARICEAEQDIAVLNRERRSNEIRYTASLEDEKALSQKILTLETKIAEFEDRQAALSRRKDSDDAHDALAVSNLILAHAMMAASYSESVKSERKLREDMSRRIAEISERHGRLESRIAQLRGERAKVSAARAWQADIESGAIRAHVLQAPSALSRPMNPPKAVPIILAGALGFLLTFFPAVFIEIGKRAAQG